MKDYAAKIRPISIWSVGILTLIFSDCVHTILSKHHALNCHK